MHKGSYVLSASSRVQIKTTCIEDVLYSTAEQIQWLTSAERGDPTFPSYLLVLLSSLLSALASICSYGQLLNQLTLH